MNRADKAFIAKTDLIMDRYNEARHAETTRSNKILHELYDRYNRDMAEAVKRKERDGGESWLGKAWTS